MGISKPIENTILYLNTSTNCIKVNDVTKNYEYTWAISPIILNEYSICKVFSIAHDASQTAGGAPDESVKHGENIITLRLKDVMINPELYRSTDNSGYPILHAMPFDSESQYYDPSLGGLFLTPQTINRITIIPSDDASKPYNGVNKDITFIIGLVFQQYDRKYSLTEN